MYISRLNMISLKYMAVETSDDFFLGGKFIRVNITLLGYRCTFSHELLQGFGTEFSKAFAGYWTWIVL